MSNTFIFDSSFYNRYSYKFIKPQLHGENHKRLIQAFLLVDNLPELVLILKQIIEWLSSMKVLDNHWS
ncbi:MAG: hypothetical protein JXB29_05600 [Sedimentisphaerales bacterium]|nr:hypothetical protein [Sedimentisphaerales bacterium]